jgi:hypothetical protein
VDADEVAAPCEQEGDSGAGNGAGPTEVARAETPSAGCAQHGRKRGKDEQAEPNVTRSGLTGGPEKKSEHDPRGDVVKGSAGDGRGPERRLQETALGKNPGKDRKCRDAHGDGQKETEIPNAATAISRIKPLGQNQASRKRHGHAANCGCGSDPALTPKFGKVDAHARQKEKDRHPRLRDSIPDGERLGRKDPTKRLRRERSEDGGSESETRRHFTNHLRLTDAPEGRADQA